MKNLKLRSEHLGELTPSELRRVAGAGDPQATVSDGSCVCTDPIAEVRQPGFLICDVSGGSCVCFCPDQTR
jgi:hypothetical protein